MSLNNCGEVEITALGSVSLAEETNVMADACKAQNRRVLICTVFETTT